jgi:hypothetical protein
MRTFFGFAIADSMFPAECDLHRETLTPEQAREVIAAGVEVCLNPSHSLTIGVMQARYGIEVVIPVRAPIVALKSGDRLLVMGVSGLPRLEGRHEYTAGEIEAAQFRFGLYTVS